MALAAFLFFFAKNVYSRVCFSNIEIKHTKWNEIALFETRLKHAKQGKMCNCVDVQYRGPVLENLVL